MKKPATGRPATSGEVVSSSASSTAGWSWSPWRTVVGFGVVSLAAEGKDSRLTSGRKGHACNKPSYRSKRPFWPGRKNSPGQHQPKGGESRAKGMDYL